LTAYFISGLGVDERAFQRIHLPPQFETRHIKWIEPLRKESLPGYVKRLAEQIDTTNDFVLIGLSFGGMIAIEISKILSPRKVILVSSITRRKYLARLFRIAGFFRLNRLIPGRLIKNPNWLIYRLFGVSKPRDKELLREILKDTSPQYISWAIHQILTWKNKFTPPQLFHIHGEKDHLLPARGFQPNKMVAGAGHLMVYTHAGEVNRFLEEMLDTVKSA
jgi:pimeloyl-ACP methyl ester carboxylesterase